MGNKKENKKYNNPTSKIDGASNRNILLNVIAYLINNGYLNKLSKYTSTNEEPTSTYIIGKHPVVSSKGRKLTKRVKGSDYYVYVTHNSRHIAQILQDIAKTINTDININMSEKRSRELFSTPFSLNDKFIPLYKPIV